MKKIVFVLTLLLFAVKSFSQTPSSSLLSKDYFLQKSKNQKTIAWVLLGSGLGIAATGGIVQLIHENKRAGGFDLDFTGAWIAIAGGVVGLSSIPFFISSAKNAGEAVAISFHYQRMLFQQQNTLVLTRQPALTIKIKL